VHGARDAMMYKKGLAISCRLLRYLMYSFAAGMLLALPSVLFIDNGLVPIYLFAVCLLPACATMFTARSSAAVRKAAATSPRESVTVAVKFAMDTLQVLELQDVGRCDECGHVFKGFVPRHCPKCGNKNAGANKKDDPLTGTRTFCVMSVSMMYYNMIVYTAIILSMPLAGIFFITEDAGILSAALVLIFTAVFSFAFWGEYYTCCKRAYRQTLDIEEVSVVRGKWVSYIETKQ